MKALRILAKESLRTIVAVVAILAIGAALSPTPSHALVENQAFGIFGVTPVTSQPAGAGQAAVTQTQDALTDSTGGTPATTLAALTALSTSNTYTDAAVNAKLTVIANSLSSIATELAKVKTDVAANNTLTNAIRTALVSLGIIKGSS